MECTSELCRLPTLSVKSWTCEYFSALAIPVTFFFFKIFLISSEGLINMFQINRSLANIEKLHLFVREMTFFLPDQRERQGQFFFHGNEDR